MNEDVPEWLIQAAQEAEALVRPAMPLIRAVQQHVEAARAAQAVAGPMLAYADQVALAIDAGMAQLAAAVWQQAGLRNVTGAGAILLGKPIVVAAGDVVTATESETVTVRGDPRSVAARSIDRLAFALILVWLVALAMPAAQPHLPPELQGILNNYYKIIPLALMVTWRARDKRK